MKNKITTQKIAIVGLFIALEIVFQIIGNFVTIGLVSLNLSLIPISLGAIIYGPIVGLILGLVNGVMVIFAPSTMSVFMPVNVFGTIFTCLIKGILAGAGCGLIYLIFKNKKPTLGSVIASISTPIINTGIFAACCYIFFYDILVKYSGEYPSPTAFLFLGMIGWNFIFELGISIIFVPVILKIVAIYKKKNQIK